MLEHVCKNWWVLLVRGICAIIFGIAAFAAPLLAELVIVIFFAAHALVDGIAAIVLGFKMKSATGGPPWGAMVLIGVTSVAAAILAFLYPLVAVVAILYIIAFWAVFRGVFEIMAAIRLRKEIDNEWLLGLAGVASILFGMILIARPGAGLIAVGWIIGAHAVVFGILEILLAFRLKGLRDRIAPAPATAA